ncbi:hypothetical protein IQ257_17760 [Coleofasciculus sp. LEGE 07092]|nr:MULTISPECIES: hypothetical protein [unclassified Coleofasciculus]MBE9127199.1 hypothetical protein [Coleofasciculus sp. LEGE 07081]MBE9150309.1 hypothetical protein [Coleofasciculus sp. LEGE 07092]
MDIPRLKINSAIEITRCQVLTIPRPSDRQTSSADIQTVGFILAALRRPNFHPPMTTNR